MFFLPLSNHSLMFVAFCWYEYIHWLRIIFLSLTFLNPLVDAGCVVFCWFELVHWLRMILLLLTFTDPLVDVGCVMFCLYESIHWIRITFLSLTFIYPLIDVGYFIFFHLNQSISYEWFVRWPSSILWLKLVIFHLYQSIGWGWFYSLTFVNPLVEVSYFSFWINLLVEVDLFISLNQSIGWGRLFPLLIEINPLVKDDFSLTFITSLVDVGYFLLTFINTWLILVIVSWLLTKPFGWCWLYFWLESTHWLRTIGSLTFTNPLVDVGYSLLIRINTLIKDNLFVDFHKSIG